MKSLLYFGDKNVNKVSGIWKVLHITIYIAIALSAFVTAMAAGNLFQTFKYNCILFCDKVTFEKDVILNEENINLNNTNMGNSTSIYYQNQTHIFEQTDENSIEITYGKIDIRKTIFPKNFWCNFVLGMALVTFIFATFCFILLAMCSKGGKGRNNTLNRPQNMVYPILFTSVLLLGLNLLATIIVKNGLQKFCINFQKFTQENECTPLINKFTLHERQGNFYLPYVVLPYSFSITVVLFLGQVCVTILRIFYAVDYQLYALEVEQNNIEDRHYFNVKDGQIVRERTL